MRPDIPELRLHAQGVARARFHTPEAIVTHLGAMQAQDYPGALWSIGLRIPDATRADVEQAILDRTIVRTSVVDSKRALHLAQPKLERLASGDAEMWMAAEREDAGTGDQRAHLLPGFDEYMLGYRDRSAALVTRHATRIVPGANGMFLSTMVLDGMVRGTWRRTAGAKSVSIDVAPFARLSAAGTGACDRHAGIFHRGFRSSPRARADGSPTTRSGIAQRDAYHRA